MSNRNYASGGKIYSMHVKPVMVTSTIQIGATGAVSSYVGSMVQSVTRISTGIYKIKLQAQTNFPRLYFASGSAQSPSSGLSGVLGIEIQNAPNESAATITGAELTIKCLDAAGAVVNPASGSAINILAIFSDSSILIQGE
jgi:hypothetical protein